MLVYVKKVEGKSFGETSVIRSTTIEKHFLITSIKLPDVDRTFVVPSDSEGNVKKNQWIEVYAVSPAVFGHEAFIKTLNESDFNFKHLIR
jgi:hypothetical protein